MLKLFRLRHFRLHDDTDDATGLIEHGADGGDSSLALLPNSKKTAFRAFLAQMGMICALVHRSSMRNLRGTIVGGCTVTLVVMFVCLLQNIVARSPLIFITLAEESAGQVDMILTSNGQPTIKEGTFTSTNRQATTESTFPLLNYTALAPAFQGIPGVVGAAPRWIIPVNVRKERAGGGHSIGDASIAATLVILDEASEVPLGIGRSWPHAPVGDGEAVAVDALLRNFGIVSGTGQRLALSLPLDRFATTGGANTNDIGAISGLTTAIVSTIVQRLSQASGSSNPSAIRVNTSAFFPNGTVPPFFPSYVDLPVPEALLAGQLGALVQESVATLLKGSFAVDVDVLHNVSSSYGRWPSILGNVVVMNSNTFLYAVKRAMDRLPLVNILNLALTQQQQVNSTNSTGPPPPTPTPLAAALVSTDETPLTDSLLDMRLQDFAFAVYVQFQNREEIYSSSFNEMREQLAKVSNAVAEAIGVGLGVTVTLPVALVLEPLKFLKLFLNQLFGACVLLIIVLASMAIYSLLISDVEQSTYEFGMLRALGLDVRSLGVLIASRAAYFTLPSLLVGLALAQLGSFAGLSYLYDFIGAERNFAMNSFALWLAVIIGIAMPIIGSYVPTMSALQTSLSSSLDVYKQSSAAVSVVATRLENLGVSGSQLAVGVGLVFIGFLVYLLIPYAFVIRDFDLMFTALNALIIVVVMGLVTLSTVAQSFLEKLLVHCMMMLTPDKRFISLVLKNLAAHRSRNQKTVLMFTIALTFVVFVGSIFFLQGASIESNLRVAFGADIVVYARWSNSISNVQTQPNPDSLATIDLEFLPQQKLEETLAREYAQPDTVLAAHSWITPQIRWNKPPVSGNRLSNLVAFPSQLRPVLHAVPADFGEAVRSEFLKLSYIRNGKDEDIFRELNSGAGVKPAPQPDVDVLVPSSLNQLFELQTSRNTEFAREFSCLMPAGIQDLTSLNEDVYAAYAQWNQVYNAATSSTLSRYTPFVVRPQAFAVKVPAFFVSGLPTAAAAPLMLVGLQTYTDLVNIGAKALGMNSTFLRPPYERLMIKLKPGSTFKQREQLINTLRNIIATDNTTITDVTSVVEGVKTSIDLINVFFYFVASIGITLCFFILLVSFDASVRQSAWEFGVLRSLGVTKLQLTRCFVYETVSSMFASICSGTVIGLGFAVVLTYQQGLFTELPFVFLFPTGLYCFVILMSVVVSIVGAVLPSRSIMSRTISETLKG